LLQKAFDPGQGVTLAMEQFLYLFKLPYILGLVNTMTGRSAARLELREFTFPIANNMGVHPQKPRHLSNPVVGPVREQLSIC
jgi:hypothetical protein